MRLIDADAVINRLDTDEYGMRLPKAVVGLTKVLLENAPTIDAVSVVRCKECKRRDENCGMGERRWCRRLNITTTPDDFCSYGERSDT